MNYSIHLIITIIKILQVLLNKNTLLYTVTALSVQLNSVTEPDSCVSQLLKTILNKLFTTVCIVERKLNNLQRCEWDFSWFAYILLLI